MATCASFFFTYASLAATAEQLRDQAVLALETYEAKLARDPAFRAKLDEDATQTEIKREFRTDETWNKLKTEEMTAQTNYRIVEKAAKAFEMKSNNMANINRRQIAKVEKVIERF